MWLDDHRSQLEQLLIYLKTTSRRDRAGWGLVLFGLGLLISFGWASLATHQSDNLDSIHQTNQPEASFQVSSTPELTATPSASITVDISGAVEKPGIYQLPVKSRVSQAITTAGGLSTRADSSYIAQQLNLASTLSDGQKLYLPFKGENLANSNLAHLTSGINSPPDSATSPEELINVNTASLDQLDTLAGIGQKRAQDIIAGRPYQSLADLVTQAGLSQSLADKIKNFITF